MLILTLHRGWTGTAGKIVFLTLALIITGVQISGFAQVRLGWEVRQATSPAQLRAAEEFYNRLAQTRNQFPRFSA